MPTEFSLLDLSRPDYIKEELFNEKNTHYLVGDHYDDDSIYIEASLFDLFLLKTLAEQQTLSIKQLHRIHIAYFPVILETLRKRLRRWSEKGVVKVLRTENTVFATQNIYSIDFEGVRLLVKTGHLRKPWLNVDVSKFLNDKKDYIKHTIGQQDVVVELLTKLKDDGILFESIAPKRYFEQEEWGEGIPDWLLRYREVDKDDVYFFVEFDTGSESVNVVKEKFKAYIRRAEKNPDKKIVLLFSMLDSSFHYKWDSKPVKEGKHANFKKVFMDSDVIIPSNLVINVNFRNRVSTVVKEIIKPMDIEERIQPLLEHFKNNWSMKVEEILSDGFYQREVSKDYYADKVLEIRDSSGGLKERVGLIVAKEGDIDNFKRINGFYEAMEGRLFSDTVHRMIVLYDDERSMDDVIVNEPFNKRVLLASRADLLESGVHPFKRYSSRFATRTLEYPFD